MQPRQKLYELVKRECSAGAGTAGVQRPCLRGLGQGAERRNRPSETNVAHKVSVIVLPARGGRRSLQQSPAEGRQAFDSIGSDGRQALVELRGLLGIVRADGEAPEQAPQPGLRNLDTLVRGVRDAGLPVTVRVEGRPWSFQRVSTWRPTGSSKKASPTVSSMPAPPRPPSSCATRTPPWNSNSAMSAGGTIASDGAAREWSACVSESRPTADPCTAATDLAAVTSSPPTSR
jgi:hypothetical protein